ncbi:MAG: bifunctional diaminohydroxyphosphoribosylaminopyrimidine deaminase/5-amino-6-(5-phosphoribosylamino)uracil reductase RibD [Acidobacteriaceae bacterium]
MQDNDEQWMERALGQAELSVGLASPNPAVGCVITRDDALVSEGFHEYDRKLHAEIVALHEAGSSTRGATAYVTLEPCTHQGRTGPCADALIAAGIARVVVATEDPNPQVHGQGIARLRAAGIEVRVGVLAEEARRLNDGFAKFITDFLPFVTMKVAATLDGRIAPPQRSVRGHFWISGEEARIEVQRMRHAADALMVGVGTIVADDPLLTDRSDLPRRRPLLRVVLDSSLRTPLDSQLVKTAHEDVLIFFSTGDPTAQRALEARGVRLQRVAAHGPRVSFQDVLVRLAEMQITTVLLEGGTEVYTTALSQGQVDRLVLFYAPSFLGETGIPMLSAIDNLPRLESYTVRQFGTDFAVEGYLRDPWSS